MRKHTFFESTKWESKREEKIEVVLTPSNIMSTMLESEDKWKVVGEIITVKENQIRRV